MRTRSRFKMYLTRVETLLREVHLPLDRLTQAREYRSQLVEMVWAIEELLGVKDDHHHVGKTEGGAGQRKAADNSGG